MIEKTVLLTQKQALVVEESIHPTTEKPALAVEQMVMTLNRYLEPWGYCLSKALMEKLLTLDLETLKKWVKENLALIKKEIGIRSNQKPFYPNFPQQVMEASEMELYWNAIRHYWTEGAWKPETEECFTYPLMDLSTLSVIELGTEADYIQLFTDKCASVAGINETDQQYVKWFVANRSEEVVNALPSEIPHRETATFLAVELMNHPEVDLTHFIKNATEVLRFATYLSGGDIHLRIPCKMKSFKRSERRLMMELLSKVKHDISEELWARRECWLRFSEKVHPMEFKSYQKIGQKFLELHQGVKPQTYNSVLESLIEKQDLIAACQHLTKRPTLFARQLDRVLRLEFRLMNGMTTYPSFVLFAFKQVATEVPVSVLFNLLTHMKSRGEDKGFRAFFPKGSLAKCYGVEGELSPLPEAVIALVIQIIEETLMAIFSQKDGLGKVYLDKSLKQYAIPFTQRTSSKSLQTIARYSRIDVSEHSHLRPFIYWQEAGGDRCDLDLSLIIFDESFEVVGNVAYYCLKGEGLLHSGDFVSAKEGASEYVDIDIETVEKKGGRYGVIMVNSFSHTPFNQLPDCFVGFMGRDGFSGEVFEPKTVIQKFDLSNDSEVCVPAIIDFKTREVIWVDMAISHPEVLNNAHTTESAANYLLRSLIATQKPTLYDLFDLHIKARGGELVEKEEEAEIAFGGIAGLQPWDYNNILANWLS